MRRSVTSNMVLSTLTRKTFHLARCVEVFGYEDTPMPCYHPVVGYRSRNLSVSGKRPLVFSRSEGFSDLPVSIPCGQCIGCRIDKSRQWALRCVHEAKSHKTSCFLTLTYSDENLPLYNSLQKGDLQRFFKRLRKDGHIFRYFACGEYSPTVMRPHYHVILFGMDFVADRKRHSLNTQGHPLFTSKYLTDKWGHGHAMIGAFNYQTAAYVARYCMKKVTGKNAQEHYVYIDTLGDRHPITPEFCLMSRRPGIGSTWYDTYKSDVFPSDFLIHQGKKHAVPRYYSNKLEQEDSKSLLYIKYRRKKDSKLRASDNTYDRLAVREEVKKAQLSKLNRHI